MPDESVPTSLQEGLDAMRPRGKEPRSVSVLDLWIARAEADMGVGRTGRLAWLVASTVVAAKLQQVVDGGGASRFSLKGGTLLQHRLGLATRATKDLDGIVRGDIEEFFASMDVALREPWGAIDFKRSEVEEIRVPSRIINPRRFTVTLMLRGRSWRNVLVEISPDEGNAGSSQESFRAPSLEGLGLPTPDHLVGMAMSYQLAQKIHGATDLHDPERGYRNDRPRDVVDIILIKGLSEETGSPSLESARVAIEDIFAARADEARALDRLVRTWPAKVTAYPHWKVAFDAAAEEVGLGMGMGMDDAVALVNDWLAAIAASQSTISQHGNVEGAMSKLPIQASFAQSVAHPKQRVYD